MRVALIVPTHFYKSGGRPLALSDFPSGLAYLSSSLKAAGHEVFGININNLMFSMSKVVVEAEIERGVKEYQPDLIGLGGLATDYAFLKDAMVAVRKHAPNTPVVMGGGIVTHDANFIDGLFKPEFSIVGEAELVLANTDLLSRGIFDHPELPEIDSLPFPDYEPFGIRNMLDNWDHHNRMLYRYTRPNPRTMVITTARGCPFSCTWCVHGHVSGRKYRARSIPNIMAEIKQMYERYEFHVLIIQDELFIANKKRLVDFCEAVIEGKEKYGWDFDWLFQAHASSNLDLETLKLAKRAGCYFWSYGLESASPVVLKSMNKHTTPEQIRNAVKLAEQAGIGFGGNLIFGDPSENPDTIHESMHAYLTYLKDCVVYTMLVQPYPGSALFDKMKIDKLHYYENMGMAYDMMGMPLDQFNAFRMTQQFLDGALWQLETAQGKGEKEEGTDAVGLSIFKVRARCPHCNEDIFYREPHIALPFKFNTCCTNCHKRIWVSVKEGLCKRRLP